MRAVGVVFLLPLLALGRGEEGEERFCSADGLCEGREGREEGEEGGRRSEEEEVRQQYEDFPCPEVSREQQEKEKLG